MTTQSCPHMQELEPRLSLSVGISGVTEGAGEFIVPPIRFELMTTGTNKFFPLEPGYKAVYEGVEDGERVRLQIIVSRKTKVVDSVRTRVVIEKETADGELKEISRNYMAIEKRTHNVFYFGEDVNNYEDGEIVNHDGSWRAGVNGAEHGLIMPGNPTVGMRYKQERAPGIAEDQAEVISLNGRLKVPAGTFNNVLKTEETNPLEPGAAEFKFYAEGVGLLKDGPARLISVRRG
jgi:hypothetical protein